MLNQYGTVPGERAPGRHLPAMFWGVRRLAMSLGVCLFGLGLGLVGLAGCGGEGGSGSGSGSRDAVTNLEPLIKPLPELQIPTPDELQRVVNKLNTGYRLVRGGEHEQAMAYFEQLRDLYPDAAVPHVHQAVGLAASGDPEAALASLEKAYELGFCDYHLVLDDPLMEEVEALLGWPGLEKRMKARIAEERPPPPGELSPIRSCQRARLRFVRAPQGIL